MAGISIYSTTSSSATLYITSLDESWSNGTRTVYWYLGSPNGGIPTEDYYYKSKTSSLANGVSSGGKVTFSGLDADTEYGICCMIYHGSTLLAELTGYVTTDYENSGGGGGSGGDTETPVEKWSWSTSNGSATSSQTSAAYRAVVNNTSVSNFSYLVWNDMVDKVMEIIYYLGGRWYNDYLSYGNTLMTSSDKTLTAKRFNSLRYNIGSRYSTGINEVSTGDPVLGSYFITLADCINDWIDTL